MAKRLGKGLQDFEGLSAIFGEDVGDVLDDIQSGHKKIEGVSEATSIALSQIKPNPYQPRTNFDAQALEELKESIALHGVFTPVLLKKSVKGYELIAGERRVRASKMAGLEEIPAMIVDFNDQQMMEVALLENIQREDLNAIEEAKALFKMIEKLSLTQDEVAQRIGKSRAYVTNVLRLLKLPTKIQEHIREDRLSMGHAKVLLSVESDEDKELLAKKVIQEGLSVRALEGLVKQSTQPKVIAKEKETTTYNEVEKTMESKFQTKVKIDDKKITITYNGVSDLNRILEIMDCLEQE